MKRILLIVASLALTLSATAQQREGVFLAEYSTKDIVATYGWFFPIRTSERETPALQYASLGYTANFWRNFAWKAGVQVNTFNTYKYGVGIPLGIAWRPGVRTWEESIAVGLESGLSSAVYDGINGRTEWLKEDLATSLIAMLFRRTEFYASLTPGYCLGPYEYAGFEEERRFYLFGDVGMVLSIPIWHITANLAFAYHYNFMHNDRGPAAGDQFHYFSIGIGLGWLF